MEYWDHFSAHSLIDKIPNFKNSTVSLENILMIFYIINHKTSIPIIESENIHICQQCNDSNDGQHWYTECRLPQGAGRWRSRDPFQILHPGWDTLITLSLGFLPLENEWSSTALIKLLSRLNEITLGWVIEKCLHSTVSDLQKCQFPMVHPTTCEVLGSLMHSKDLFRSSRMREGLLVLWILVNNSVVPPPTAHPRIHGHQ